MVKYTDKQYISVYLPIKYTLMNHATISADVISFTSLNENERHLLSVQIKQILEDIRSRFADIGFYGRLVKGDLIECAMNSPKYSLRIALLLKAYIKSIDFGNGNNTPIRLKYFSTYGVRVAVAVAPLNKIDPIEGIIDGEAIYLSGRMIDNFSTSDKKKIIVKSSMYFLSSESKIQEQYDTLFSLIDILISKCSAKQSEVLYYKLLSYSEKEIAEKLFKNQSTISQHSTAAGWNAIDKALEYYENTIE